LRGEGAEEEPDLPSGGFCFADAPSGVGGVEKDMKDMKTVKFMKGRPAPLTWLPGFAGLKLW
jgi:hypothetical protein